MKKVVAFVGSGRKRHTYNAVRKFLDDLESYGDVETEIVRLSEYKLETCRGCYTCFAKGEEHCPFKDDRDVLIGKIEAADGVVWASPNYAFQVSGLMKVFLDRISFVFHRPRWHGKVSTSIVVEGINGGKKLVKYLDFVAWGLGMSVVKGTVHNSREPMPEKLMRKRQRVLEHQARNFHDQMSKPADRVPGLADLAVFRYARTLVGTELDETSLDYNYFSEKGWFQSDYWYPTSLGPAKRLAGSVIDSLAGRMSRARAV